MYARDGAFPSLYSWCTVEISVLDVNDNAPRFAFDNDAADSVLATVSIPENENGATYVYTALATDPDSGDNGNVTFNIIGTFAMLTEYRLGNGIQKLATLHYNTVACPGTAVFVTDQIFHSKPSLTAYVLDLYVAFWCCCQIYS